MDLAVRFGKQVLGFEFFELGHQLAKIIAFFVNIEHERANDRWTS